MFGAGRFREVAEEGEERRGGGGEDEEMAGAGAIADWALCAWRCIYSSVRGTCRARVRFQSMSEHSWLMMLCDCVCVIHMEQGLGCCAEDTIFEGILKKS